MGAAFLRLDGRREFLVGARAAFHQQHVCFARLSRYRGLVRHHGPVCSGKTVFSSHDRILDGPGGLGIPDVAGSHIHASDPGILDLERHVALLVRRISGVCTAASRCHRPGTMEQEAAQMAACRGRCLASRRPRRRGFRNKILLRPPHAEFWHRRLCAAGSYDLRRPHRRLRGIVHRLGAAIAAQTFCISFDGGIGGGPHLRR